MTIETTDDSAQMNAAVDHILEHSKVKANGLRELPKAAFFAAMVKHGVTEDDYKKVQHAVDYETTAAARVALADLENKIGSASADDLASEDFRKGLTSSVRLPTFGGATEVEVRAERHSPIPFRGDADGNGAPQVKVSHAIFRTTINAKARIHKNLHDEARDRIRTKLGITTDD